jgi:predicted nucleic-acid-binding protein
VALTFGLDTNVLVRFLLSDDQEQAEQARMAIDQALISGKPVAVCLLTLLETEGVLRSCASLDKRIVITTFRMLLEAQDITIEHEETLEKALFLYENHSADFADCLMAAHCTRIGCSSMLTFDRKAAQLPGVAIVVSHH